LQHITGRADGPGLVCPAAFAIAADGILLALKALLPTPTTLPASGAMLLGERARLMGLRRKGSISANGSCRLLEMRNDIIALNLARQDDWTLIPALLGGENIHDWVHLAAALHERDARPILDLGIELGLPIALSRPVTPPSRFFEAMPLPVIRTRVPIVVELASLWAGPLASSLLAMAGARVIKVESSSRPDGARTGNGPFFDLLNGAKQSVLLDFSTAEGRGALRRLLRLADIIIEGSRPRALRQLGISQEQMIKQGAVWVSISAHGAAEENRVGFGDDTAVAGGLAAIMAAGWGEPMFAGDAIADPLAGLQAALGAWTAWRSGGSRLVEISLRDSIRHGTLAGIAGSSELSRWQHLATVDDGDLYALRKPIAVARRLGADTRTVMSEC
jgi:hypothetical protein